MSTARRHGHRQPELPSRPEQDDHRQPEQDDRHCDRLAQAALAQKRAEIEDKEQEHEIQTALEQKHDAQYQPFGAIKGVASTHPTAAPQPAPEVPDVTDVVVHDEGDDRVPGDTPSYRLSTGASRAKRQSETAPESNKKKKSDNNTTGPMGRSRK